MVIRRPTAKKGVESVGYLHVPHKFIADLPEKSTSSGLIHQRRKCTSLIESSPPSHALGVEGLLKNSDNEEPCLQERIGTGTYSDVYKCRQACNGKIYAIKVIKMNKEEGAPGTAIWEASLLKMLHHENVIALHKIRYDPGKLHILLEYARYNLNSYMTMYQLSSNQSNVESLARQFFRGLSYVHGKSIIHRDLKPENLLITDNGTLKIADFTIQVCQPVSKFGTHVSTLWYKAPELLLEINEYGSEIDIWSAGCILYEMMKGKALFGGLNDMNQLKTIFEDIGVPSSVYWPELFFITKFQLIKPTLRQFGPPLIDMNPETHNIQARLLPKFQRNMHQNWLSRMDAFKLLEMCLQPRGSQRITAEQALNEMAFLGGNSPIVKSEVPDQLKKGKWNKNQLNESGILKDHKSEQVQNSRRFSCGNCSSIKVVDSRQNHTSPITLDNKLLSARQHSSNPYFAMEN
nr:cyclin dependent kinase 14 [Hymenolepis microstoma]